MVAGYKSTYAKPLLTNTLTATWSTELEGYEIWDSYIPKRLRLVV